MLGLTRGRLIAIVAAVIAGIGIGVGSRYLLPGGDAPATIRQISGLGDASIGGPFQLVDTEGRVRTDAENKSIRRLPITLALAELLDEIECGA